MRPALRLAVASAATALALAAQGIQWGSPVSGLIYDAPTKSLRQVLGFPGGARLGPTLLPGITWAAVSPAGKSALIILNSQMRFVTSQDIVGGSPGIALDGLAGEPKLACWAEDSSAVALYWTEGRALQRISLNTGKPVVEQAAEIKGLDGELTALTADRSGRVMAAVTADGAAFLLARDGSATRLLPGVEASAIVLNAEGTVLWAADRTARRILRRPISGADSDIETVCSDPERLVDVTVLGLSSDGKRVILADRSTRMLHQFDIASGSLDEGLALDAAATALYPLGDPTLKLLTPRGKPGEPLYLMDEKKNPSVFFVPASDVEAAQ